MENEVWTCIDDFKCKKCQAYHDFPYDYCCLYECGEHEFCRGCERIK